MFLLDPEPVLIYCQLGPKNLILFLQVLVVDLLQSDSVSDR